MGRVIRVTFDEVENNEGELVLHFENSEETRDVHVAFYAECECTLYFDTEKVVLPVFNGSTHVQAYSIPPEVSSLRIVPHVEKALIAYRVLVNNVRHRDNVDPIPDVVPVPLDDNSLQLRVMRAVEAQMAQLGLAPKGGGRGHDYDRDDESEDDPEQGEGYHYDEEVDREIVTAATNAVRERLQRGKSPKPTTEPVSGDEPPAPKPSAEPAGSPAGGRKPPPLSS